MNRYCYESFDLGWDAKQTVDTLFEEVKKFMYENNVPLTAEICINNSEVEFNWNRPETEEELAAREAAATKSREYVKADRYRTYLALKKEFGDE